MLGYMIWLCGWVFVENLVNNNKAESTKNTPAENLNQNVSSLMNPPANDAERDVIINEKKVFLSKYPFEINLIEGISATIIFKISDVGFILSRGGEESNAITAKYPDAPACPTDEYRNAIRKNSPQVKIIISISNMLCKAYNITWFNMFLKTQRFKN